MNKEIKNLKISVCFCAWNEENNIEKCIEDTIENIPKITNNDFEVIVIDNDSTDSTPDIVTKYSKKDNRVRLIRHPKNLFYSGSHRTALKEAKGDYIFIIDGDYQHTTKDVAKFLNKVIKDNFDIIYGWKKIRHDGFMRKIFSSGLKIISQVMLNHNLHDINCGYRLFSRKAADNIIINEKFNSIGPELIGEARRIKLKVGEQVVEHFSREEGEGLYDSLPSLVKNTFRYINYMNRIRKRYGRKNRIEVTL